MSSGCGDVLSLQDLKTAKLHQIFEAEVITGKAGGVPSGADINFATDPVTGQTQKTLPAIMRDIGFEPASFDFTTGGTLSTNDRNKSVLWPSAGGGDNDYYYWQGSLPKVIPAGSSPSSTGGIASGAWRPVGDITLRGQLLSPADNLGDALVATRQPVTGAVARTQHNKNSDVLTFEDFGAKGDGVTDDTAALQAAALSGVRTVESSVFPAKKNYKISAAINVTSQIELNFDRSEIMQTVDAPHFRIGFGSSQVNSPMIIGATMTNTVATTQQQIVAQNVGLMTIKNAYCYGDNKAFGFIRLNNTIVTNIIDCASTGTTGKDIQLVGLGNGALKTFDTTISGGRFERGVTGMSLGDYVEGVFVRAAVFYSYSKVHLEVGASSTAKAISLMFDSVNFDSPSNDNFIYLDNVQAAQFNSCWFSGQDTDYAINIGPGADTVLIDGAQAYINNAFLLDAGVGTMLTGSTINGGTVPVQFGSTANFTAITANTFRSSTSACVLVDNHVGQLHISSNFFRSQSGDGIGGTEKTGMVFENNKGDKARGATTAAFAGATSPLTLTVGARPENITLIGGSITSVVVNTVQVWPLAGSTYAKGSLGLGVLPPGSVVVLTFNTADAPWLMRVKQ